ncbi:unnamed protein product [Phytophthora fragariaefolia]|uniref:Unnamed protein product n=1 Tax=Phytophthora fragariaefolia TaxID=1490495 RepID=A0A9W6WUE5_9STRA|nr:unnamed protein product [Phytophthora fragariaefolia]
MAVELGPEDQENKLRLLKAKFLLQQQLKAERAAKNRRMLEILCEGLKRCSEEEGDDGEVAAEFRKYFGVKLKACLVKMHAATGMAKYAEDNEGVNSFAGNLKYLRATLPNYVDKSFLVRSLASYHKIVELTLYTAFTAVAGGGDLPHCDLVLSAGQHGGIAAAG